MYYFIINPKSSSGKGIRYWWTVKKELDLRQIPYIAEFTKYPGHASQLANQICSQYDGIKNIVVLGGDGTLNEVVNGIDNFDQILLGYIPSGSSNDLARSLGIPKDPKQALENILKPTRFKYLDYGIISFPDTEAETRKFCCSSGVGYDAEVCVEVQASPLKKRLNRFGAGKLIYLAIAIKQLITLKAIDITLFVDGVKKGSYQNVFLMCAMIHKYEGGGLMVAPHADPTDGKLSVCLAHGLGRLKAFFLLPTLVFGKHVKFKGIEAFHCNQLEIMVSREAAVHTDGETPAFSSHIQVNCMKGRIRMIL